MTHFARHFGAALICAFLWLSVSGAQAGEPDCRVIFEAIPSKDAGPIIGAEVSHKLATKNFASWRGFTQRQAIAVALFLNTNFEEVATFGEPIEGFGGFEGKSSPNAFIIPTVIDQNPCAHLRMPRDMIFHGWSMRLFQAWQHSATMSS